MVTMTKFEFDQLSPAAKKLHLQREEKLVFGMKDDSSPDFKRDKDGAPIQNGIGSKGHETANHFAALLKAEKEGREPEGAYAAAVAEIWHRDPKRAKTLGLPQPDAKYAPAPRKAKKFDKKLEKSMPDFIKDET